MTSAEKKHLSAVASLGCLICGSPAEIHHPRFCAGMSQRASNFLAVPLCPLHHRNGCFGEAIHQGQSTFESKYMSEAEMLSETIKRLCI